MPCQESEDPPSLRTTRTLLESTISFVCNALISCEQQINIYDDSGHCGTNVSLTCQLIKRELFKENDSVESCRLRDDVWTKVYPMSNLLTTLSVVCSSGKGSLNMQLSELFRLMSSYLSDHEQPSKQSVMLRSHGSAYLILSSVLSQAIQELVSDEEHSNIRDKTFLDVLHAITKVLQEMRDEGETILTDLEVIELATRTAEMTAANTVKSPSSFADPGAHAVGIAFRAFYQGLKSCQMQ